MRLKPKLLEKSYQELELNFRLYTRALVGLACNLHRGRELRSLFIDLLERLQAAPSLRIVDNHNYSRKKILRFKKAVRFALKNDVLMTTEVKLL
ncbi:hypothetical protein evm_013963 [Chilo suppressalis]|nr:hypothetical protein evm_013963 [Chilo suppressalis]